MLDHKDVLDIQCLAEREEDKVYVLRLGGGERMLLVGFCVADMVEMVVNQLGIMVLLQLAGGDSHGSAHEHQVDEHGRHDDDEQVFVKIIGLFEGKGEKPLVQGRVFVLLPELLRHPQLPHVIGKQVFGIGELVHQLFHQMEDAFSEIQVRFFHQQEV